jgi:hypothetical protein
MKDVKKIEPAISQPPRMKHKQHLISASKKLIRIYQDKIKERIGEVGKYPGAETIISADVDFLNCSLSLVFMFHQVHNFPQFHL